MLPRESGAAFDIGEEKGDRAGGKTAHFTSPRSCPAPGSTRPPGRASALLQMPTRMRPRQAKSGAELQKMRNPAGGRHLSENGNSLASCVWPQLASLRFQRFENKVQ